MTNRLEVVRRTYEKAYAGELVTGRNKLVEILERVVGLVDANRIIDEVSEVLTKDKNTVFQNLTKISVMNFLVTSLKRLATPRQPSS